MASATLFSPGLGARQGEIYLYVCTFVHLYIGTLVHFFTCTFLHLYISTIVHLYICTKAKHKPNRAVKARLNVHRGYAALRESIQLVPIPQCGAEQRNLLRELYSTKSRREDWS